VSIHKSENLFQFKEGDNCNQRDTQLYFEDYNLSLTQKSDKSALWVHERITSQSLGGEALGGQGVKVQEYLDIPSFHYAVRRDASPDKM